MTIRYGYFFFALLAWNAAEGQTTPCDLREYHAVSGLTAEPAADGLRVTWSGDRGQPLRAVFALRGGQPLIHELALERNGS
ncbi:MAG TPA: hypothetical protein VG672_19605, partial [Bryobacteraceae bacterium]|nr:hypothetical protein [Bryobacteraceae bacterium]